MPKDRAKEKLRDLVWTASVEASKLGAVARALWKKKGFAFGDAFGVPGSGTAKNPPREGSWDRLYELIYNVVPEQLANRTFDAADGSAPSSPWLLKTKGSGELHNDIDKRESSDTRGKAGEYRDAAAAFVCISGTAVLNIWSLSTHAKVLNTPPMMQLQVVPGSVVFFPARCMHKVEGSGARFVFNGLLVSK